ncbi:MAG: hypothetical protein MUC42_14855 [Bryobacter sp.]|jgi:hypothetical protein|nr:hypothetical protein [Bryobacter sp.]
MLSPRPICVLVFALLVLAAVPAYAAFTVYSGPTTTTQPTFLTAAGAPAPAAVDWSAYSTYGNLTGIASNAFANMGGITVSTDPQGFTFDGIADSDPAIWNMSGPTFALNFSSPSRTLLFSTFPSALRVFALEIGANTNSTFTIRVKTATSAESSYTFSNMNSLVPNTNFLGVIADESISYIAIDTPSIATTGTLVVGDILTREGGAPPPPSTEPPPGGETPEASTLVLMGSSLFLLSRIRRGGLTWLRDGVA